MSDLFTTNGIEIEAKETSGAIFDYKRQHRYWLWRFDKMEGRYIQYIGLNPSTANETKNDPTITKLAMFTKTLGFDGFYMTNLFTYITPYPEQLEWRQDEPYRDVLRDIRQKCKTVVVCWGNFQTHGRDRQVTSMFPDALCFGKNQNGSPKHPLYLRHDTKLIKF